VVLGAAQGEDSLEPLCGVLKLFIGLEEREKLIFPLAGETKTLEGGREEKELFQVYLNNKVFIQCNKNTRDEISWVVRLNILTLLSVFFKVLAACKIKSGGISFRKGENGMFELFKNAYFFEHKHFLKCDLNLLIFLNLSVPKRHFPPQNHLFFVEKLRRVRYQVSSGRNPAEMPGSANLPSPSIPAQQHPSSGSRGAGTPGRAAAGSPLLQGHAEDSIEPRPSAGFFPACFWPQTS